MNKSVSLVYKNIYVYRFIMNILYGMKYKKRFDSIIDIIDSNDNDIVELCFGDVYIAKYAKSNGKDWVGLDINDEFVRFAKAQGFNALNKNILNDDIPKSDVCIMAGSLYHFIENIETILIKLLDGSKKVIISEPIKNLSNNKYIGMFARKSANAGNGDEEFRFTESSFIEMLEKYKEKLSFTYEIIKIDRDILVVLKCL